MQFWAASISSFFLVKFVNIQARCDIWKQQINHSAAKVMKEDFANKTICNVISLHPSHTEHSRTLESCCKQIVFTGNIFLGPILECVALAIGVQ